MRDYLIIHEDGLIEIRVMEEFELPGLVDAVAAGILEVVRHSEVFESLTAEGDWKVL